MDYFSLYYSFISNLFDFAQLELFSTYMLGEHTIKRRNLLRNIFIFFYLVYSFTPYIPYNVLFCQIMNYIYIYSLSNKKLKSSVILFIKYNIFYYTSMSVVYFIYTFLTHDVLISSYNETYFSYKSLTCTAIVYILLNIYINYKKLRDYKKSQGYIINFTLIAAFAIISLSASTMLLESSIIDQQNALPAVYILLTIIVVLCISAYRKITYTMQEQALINVQLEKAQLEKKYYAQVDDNLTQLHTLRHDMKNHLIIIRGYAHLKNYEKLDSYLDKITDEFPVYSLIETPSPLVSTLLNSKNQDCIKNNIALNFTQNFSNIYIDDFSIITILGNMLDNAITASSNVNVKEMRYINLSMTQADSLLKITCSNHHIENIQKKGANFISSKLPDSSIHGLGINNIKKAIDKLEGNMDIIYDEHNFTMTITTPNYN